MRTNCPTAQFRRLSATSVILSSIGDVFFDMYVAWSVSNGGRDLAAVAGVLAANEVFRAAIALPVGSVTDAVSRRKAMTLSMLLPALLLGSIGACATPVTENLGAAVSIVLILSFCGELFNYSNTALAADLLETQEFIKYRALVAMCTRIVTAVGFLIAGVLIQVMSGRMVLLLDAGTFLLGAAAAARIPRLGSSPAGAARGDVVRPGKSLRGLMSDLVFSIGGVWRLPVTRAFMLTAFTLNVAYGFVPAILPIFIGSLHNGAGGMGTVRLAVVVGDVVGLAVVSRLGGKVSLLFKTSLILCPLAVTAAMCCASIRVGVFAMFLYSCFDCLTQPLYGYTVKVLEPESRGRLMAGMNSFILLASPMGILVGTFVLERGAMWGVVFAWSVFLVALLIAWRSRLLQNVDMEQAKQSLSERGSG